MQNNKQDKNTVPVKETLSSWGGKALDYTRGFGMRVFVHMAAVAAAIASGLLPSIPASMGMTATACVYTGLICIAARGMSRTSAWIVPALAGAVQTLVLVVSGFPLYHALLWGGAQSWLQRLLHKRLQMGGEWLVLLLLLPLGISLADSTPLLPLLPSFITIGAVAKILLLKLAPRTVTVLPPEKREAEIPPAVAVHRASLATLRGKKHLLPQNAQNVINSIATTTESILQCMILDARDIEPGNRFLKRYLGATLTVADKHARLAREQVVTPDVIRALFQSDEMLVRLEVAFAKEHAYLLKNDATDFSAELNVLDTLLKMDGR